MAKAKITDTVKELEIQAKELFELIKKTQGEVSSLLQSARRSESELRAKEEHEEKLRKEEEQKPSGTVSSARRRTSSCRRPQPLSHGSMRRWDLPTVSPSSGREKLMKRRPGQVPGLSVKQEAPLP